jgi:hypothetical protein
VTTVTIAASPAVTTQDLVLTAVPPVFTFPTGTIQFFSTPYDYSALTMTQLLGPLNTSTTSTPNGTRSHVFYWSPTLLQYIEDPTPPADSVKLGLGYWVETFESIPFAQGLGPRPTATTVSISLAPGWNAIGVPSLSPVNVSALTFPNPANNSTLTFAEASGPEGNLVSPVLFGWNGSAYFSVIASSGGTVTPTTMQPWQAYWIFANSSCSVNIPTGN